MNLRCPICCLNAGVADRERHGPVSLLFMGAIHTSTPAIYLSLPRVLLRCSSLPLSLFSSRLPVSGLAPSSRESWPRKRREKKGAGGDGRVEKRGERRERSRAERKGWKKTRLKYHEDIIRYRRVVYPYRHPSLWPYKTTFHPHSWRRRTR